MNILVCIKQVPDTTEIRMDPKTNTLIRAGVPSTVNPLTNTRSRRPCSSARRSAAP